jgi:hypothetical protein
MGNKAEEDLNVMGIKIRQAIIRDPWEWRRRRKRRQMRNTYHFHLSYAFCNAAYIRM